MTSSRHRKYMEEMGATSPSDETSAIPEKSAGMDGPEQRSKLESLGLFVGTVSHSIKGLCTGLEGGIYLVNSAERQGLPDRRARGWAMIVRNTNRLRRLVNNTLYYGKERILELEDIHIDAIQSGILEILGNKARRLGISLNISEGESHGAFRADLSAITAAVVNLVENALDACAADTRNGDHIVDVITGGTRDVVRIQIRDNGIGMDLDTRKTSSDLFFSSKGSSGTGLGLYIAEQIVRSHDGTLTIRSGVGEGTDVSIILPRSGPRNRTEVSCEP